MKYIDAEKLITIIEERKTQQDQWINRYHDPINQGVSQELNEILSIITSLQQEQPEVDLEKEIKDWCDKEVTGVNPIYTGDSLTYSMLPRTARHFYELGQSTMRKRITNPEYNQKVIEKIKSEYPMDESKARKGK